MARCKACNTPFSESDFVNPRGMDEELCSYCRFVSDNPNYLSQKEYQFESLTEVPVYLENYENTVDK